MRSAATATCSLLLIATACVGTDVGNPVVDLDFTMYNETFDEQGTSARTWAPGDTIAVTEAWVSVDQIRLRDAVNCDGDAEVELVGPFAVDLLEPGPVPELSDVEVPALEYCRFELRWDALEPPLPAGVPAGLEGASIFVRGRRGDDTPFVVRSDRGDELRLDAVTGAFPIDEATGALFVGFDAARLLAGVDLDGATVGNDGVIRIEDGFNDVQLAAFENNVDAATELFDDHDEDSVLDSDERQPSEVLAD